MRAVPAGALEREWPPRAGQQAGVTSLPVLQPLTAMTLRSAPHVILRISDGDESLGKRGGAGVRRRAAVVGPLLNTMELWRLAVAVPPLQFLVVALPSP